MEKITLTTEEKTELDNYPKISITPEEFGKLPEYSMSVPTQSGSIGVKRWKHRTPLEASDKDAIWFLGEVKGKMNVFHHIVISNPNPNLEQNLIDIANVNRELAKNLVERKFQMIQHPVDHVHTFSGIAFINPIEFKQGSNEGIMAEIFHGIGKLIGVNTSGWAGRTDDEILKVKNVILQIWG